MPPVCRVGTATTAWPLLRWRQYRKHPAPNSMQNVKKNKAANTNVTMSIVSSSSLLPDDRGVESVLPSLPLLLPPLSPSLPPLLLSPPVLPSLSSVSSLSSPSSPLPLPSPPVFPLGVVFDVDADRPGVEEAVCWFVVWRPLVVAVVALVDVVLVDSL